MPEFLSSFNPAVLAGPLFIIFIVVEMIAIRLRGKGGQYEEKDAATSMIMAIGSGIVDGALAFVGFGILMVFYSIAPFKISSNVIAGITCFVLYDLCFYFAHRYQHRCRWGWAAHIVHHSSQHYNLTTALRQTWTGLATGAIVIFIPLVLLGFHPVLIVFCGGLNRIGQFWFHTQLINQCPSWFEAIMNTPSHHRVHHARNPRYLDANYGGVFIIWDRLFRTFVPEHTNDRAQYGHVSNIGTFNPLRVFSHEYVNIWKDVFAPGLKARQRLFYVFAPPGWSHDGNRKSSPRIKSDYLKRFPENIDQPGFEVAKRLLESKSGG